MGIQGEGSTRAIKNCSIQKTTINGSSSIGDIGQVDKQNIMYNRVDRIKKNNENELTVLYTNADSLQNKLNELQLLIQILDYRPSVIAITEVKHKHNWHSQLSEFNLKGYTLYYNDLDKNPRGIIMYVDKSLISKQIIFEVEFQENMAVEIKNDNNSLLICTIYRSPSSVLTNDKQLFLLLDKISKHSGIKLILGDFNYGDIDWEKWEDNKRNISSTLFLKSLRDNYMIQNVTNPTRSRGKDIPHMLDLVITDDYFIKNIEHLSPLGKSDHDVLLIKCNLSVADKQIESKMNFNKGNYCELRQFMRRNWDQILLPHSEDVNAMWQEFSGILNEGVNNYIPKVKGFRDWKKSKWKAPLPETLRKSIKKKKRLWNRFMETRSEVYMEQYKKIRNNIRKETRNIYKTEQNEIAKASKKNPKKFWNYVKSKTTTMSSIGDINCNLDGHDKFIIHDDKKAAAFCDHFTNIFTKETDEDKENIIKRMHTEDMIQPNFDKETVLRKLEGLNINKSPGPDLIHPRILYELRYEILCPLQQIFKSSLRLGELPNDWRAADVTAIFKKGSKKDMSNYRPVSLTSIVCKIMESIIRDQLMDYLVQNKFLSNKQFGFIKGRSTIIQLLNILDNWTNSLEEGGQIDVVYTDFEKAFDKVPHKRLLQKLSSYNVPDEVLRWIKAFLSERKQRVKINGKYSRWNSVISGIPQGSVLGPLLFVIYINDLPEICDKNADVYLFADDAKVFKYIKCVEDQLALQNSISNLQAWANKWLLKLNIDKCKVLSYGRNSNLTFDYHLQIQNKVHNLEHLTEFKDLGVLFDDKLTFSSHCHERINKAYSILGIIKRNFMYLSADAFVLLYKSMVRSRIEYANSVWLPYRLMMIKDLEKVQMRATKLIISIKKLPYKERLMHLKLPTLKYRRLRGDMIEIYKIVTNRYDKDINLILNRDNDSRTRGNKYKLHSERSRYDLRKYSFTVRTVNIWNSLPNTVVDAITLDTFKNRLDKFWDKQEIKFDYKAELNGIGERSFLEEEISD